MMSEITVGIRELKNQISAYLRQVKSGQTIVITDRGKPIGRIIPSGESVEERMHKLVRAGVINWNGKRLKPHAPTVINRGDHLVSDLVVEDREIDSLS